MRRPPFPAPPASTRANGACRSISRRPRRWLTAPVGRTGLLRGPACRRHASEQRLVRADRLSRTEARGQPGTTPGCALPHRFICEPPVAPCRIGICEPPVARYRIGSFATSYFPYKVFLTLSICGGGVAFKPAALLTCVVTPHFLPLQPNRRGEGHGRCAGGEHADDLNTDPR